MKGSLTEVVCANGDLYRVHDSTQAQRTRPQHEVFQMSFTFCQCNCTRCAKQRYRHRRPAHRHQHLPRLHYGIVLIHGTGRCANSCVFTTHSQRAAFVDSQVNAFTRGASYTTCLCPQNPLYAIHERGLCKDSHTVVLRGLSRSRCRSPSTATAL